MKRLAIVVALPGELRSLTKTRLRSGEIVQLSNNVMVGLSGVGAEQAHRIGKRMLESGVSGLVSWGSAASLDDTVLPGGLLLPMRIVSGYSTMTVDYHWHTRLWQCLSKNLTLYHQTLVHSEGLLSNTEEKRRLAGTANAVGADMESATLVSLAKDYGVPFVAIRAVSDSVGMMLPHSIGQAMSENGQVRIQKVLLHTMIRPREWPALLQLQRGFRAAQLTLSRVAQHAGPGLLGPGTSLKKVI
jgi:adenosylhomocysteine nucleosidase